MISDMFSPVKRKSNEAQLRSIPKIQNNNDEDDDNGDDNPSGKKIKLEENEEKCIEQ